MYLGWISVTSIIFVISANEVIMRIYAYYYHWIFRYYEATIDAISEDGVVNITFNEYKNTDVTMLSQLKSVAKRPASDWADQKSKWVNNYLLVLVIH